MIQRGSTLGAAVIGIILAGAMLADRADACRCLEPSSAAAAYRGADAAVVGKVLSVAPGSATDESEAVIEVEEAWKARMLKTVHISTGTDCAFNFTKGASYLLFLVRDADGRYSTERCMGNREISKAASFLAWLRKNGEAGKVGTAASNCQGD
jgi:hypothetical protein